MDSNSSMTTTELDELFLRRAFDVARRSLTHGNHPFGALLVKRLPVKPFMIAVSIIIIATSAIRLF